MNKFKRITSLLIVLSLIVIPINVHAKPKSPEIVISSGVEDVPDYMIQEIISENPDAGRIHILDYDYLPETKPIESVNDDSPNVTTNDVVIGFHTKYGPVTTTKVVSVYDNVAKDVFMFSVAKGETKTIQTTYTSSLSGSISGTVFSAVDLGVNATITGSYYVGTTYTGPEESSPYNSREYRMKFYRNIGTYTQVRTVSNFYYLTLLNTETQTTSGGYTQPTKYLSYSIDSYVTP